MRRVHELAKEWNVDTKDLIARLEKIGLRGRRSQSSMSEEEIQRAMQELGFGPKPTVTIGGERMVTGEAGQTLVERRVGTKVIRRRNAAPASLPEDLSPIEPLEPLGLQSEALQTFASPEPLPEPIESPSYAPMAAPDLPPP
ncbi:MAG TPA: translation initiation factor IF-2 N-terminal domain-containing protein, partial [Candidatus Binatia bacterium]|nr:translation initiation factor IF-2 N-terminal domain-containing protein [Candidatus Binatia bacterium]